MKNLHILQTDKPSRLAYDFDKLILNSRLLSPILYKTQHIYITSNEEDKKIILTTDQDLIKYGVQKIDDESLEWFVKNPSCEEIEIESNYKVKSGTIQEHSEGKAGYEYYDYKIIIPKEETKQYPRTFKEWFKQFRKR